MTLAITVFCEDIRQESGGSATLIGIMPDNIGVSDFPSVVPKLGIYTRIVIPSDAEPQEMKIILRKPDGGEDVLGEFTREFVQAGCEQARQRGNPTAGFVGIAIASPFGLPEAGRYLAIVHAGAQELTTGTANFEIAKQPN